MDFDDATAYQALLTRDARFDGRFFVGVTSTGVYCRPICRVRTPKAANCRFFETPAQAESADYRPCLKCRPEIAPGAGLPWSVMDASRTLARQAAHWLDTRDSADDAVSVTQLAGRLGISDRHLRRIFLAEHGVTPVQHLQTRRLLLAKQLLTDTTLPMTEVALAAGFGSLRRFNAAFASRYRIAPSRLRRQADTADAPPPDRITISLGYREPYDIARMTRFLATHAIPRIEHTAPGHDRRSVPAGLVGAEAGWIETRFEPERARVRVAFSPAWAPVTGRVAAAVRRWLDLDAAPDVIDAALHGLPGDAGLRLPGSLDPFELAVRAVLGQQVNVAVACTLAKRFVERFGDPISTPWPEVDRSFPRPERFAGCEVPDIAELGIIRSRAGAILALARAWPTFVPSLHGRAPPDDLIAALCALPGIGPWTAHYIAMRALSWPDAFPPNDVAVLKAMKQLFGTASQREAEQVAAAHRPWRSYAVMRLWNSLDKTP